MLRVLDTQHSAVRQLIHDTGVVFDAAGRRQRRAGGAVRSGDAVLSTTARRNARPGGRDEHPADDARRAASNARRGAAGGHRRRPGRARAAPGGDASSGPTLDRDRRARARPEAASSASSTRPSTSRAPRCRPPRGSSTPRTPSSASSCRRSSRRCPWSSTSASTSRSSSRRIASLAAATQATSRRPRAGRRCTTSARSCRSPPRGCSRRTSRFGTNRHNPYLAPLGMLKLRAGVDSFDCRTWATRAAERRRRRAGCSSRCCSRAGAPPTRTYCRRPESLGRRSTRLAGTPRAGSRVVQLICVGRNRFAPDAKILLAPPPRQRTCTRYKQLASDTHKLHNP